MPVQPGGRRLTGSEVRGLATGIAAGFDAVATMVSNRAYPPAINDKAATALSVRVAKTVAGAAHLRHMPKLTTGSEDFAFMLNAKQGSHIMLGAGYDANDAMPHHSKHDFNDSVLPDGASYWATLAEQLLPRRS
jgi:metal-dependent amidase/aminoacylase/carboxypeptidase family protein